MTINYITVSSDKTTLNVSVSTSVGETFTGLSYWNRTTYKNDDTLVDLSSKFAAISENEIFTINVADVSETFFNDVHFLEFTDTLLDIKIGVVLDLDTYNACMIAKIMEIEQVNDVDLCTLGIINPFIILQNIKAAFEIGYYTEGIRFMNILDNICASTDCSSCTNTGDDVYYSGIKYD